MGSTTKSAFGIAVERIAAEYRVNVAIIENLLHMATGKINRNQCSSEQLIAIWYRDCDGFFQEQVSELGLAA